MRLNQNQTLRDRILDPFFTQSYDGGIRRFENVTYYVLHQLFNEGFVDPDGTQNYSPTNKEFLDFLKTHKENFSAHGYVVSNNREDYRVSIEGLSGSNPTKEDIIDFTNLCRSAEEFEASSSYLYSWWD